MRILIVILAILTAATAAASVPDLFGFGARSVGLAGTVVSQPRGYDAVYHNPAGLAFEEKLTVTFGYSFGRFNLDLDGRHGDHPDATATTIGAGLPLPLGGVLKDKLALGFGFVIPTNTVLRAYLPQPDAPQFSVVGNRTQTVTLQAAVSFRITDGISLGTGFMALSALEGAIDVAPNAEGRIGSAARDQLVARYAPIIGVYAKLSQAWQLGLVYRGESAAEFDLPLTANLGDGFPLPIPTLTVHGTAQYDPRQVELEGSWTNGTLSIALGLTWNQWSRFPKPIEYAARPDTLAPLPAPGWSDTYEGSLGAEKSWEHGSLSGTIRSGYRFIQSPAPPHQTEYALLDNQRHVLAMGHSLNWSVFRWTLGAQFHFLPDDETRRTPLDGTSANTYKHGGHIWVLSTEIGLEL